jgi:dynein heavy chain
MAARPLVYRRCFALDVAALFPPQPSNLCLFALPRQVALVSTMEEYLRDHNGTSKRPMNLAMFLFAVEHVSRICRLLKQPGACLGTSVRV